MGRYQVETANTRRAYPTKQRALEAAQSYCYRRRYNAASVYNTRGRLVIRYWWEGQGLQYIEY